MSTKRIRKRIERDKLRRSEKNNAFMNKYDNFDNIITYQNYYQSLEDCNKGVGYKRSVQEFNQNAITQIHEIIGTIESGQIPVLSKVKKVSIRERGKERIITPIRIDDRITQKVVCDNCLVDSVQRHLIYDNGASTKGKGTNFARNRIYEMMNRAVQQYGSDFYVLKFDFKSFFDSIPHQTCIDILNETFKDKRVAGFVVGIIKSYPLREAKSIEDPGERDKAEKFVKNNLGKGICLGSQISQVMALAVPNELDHFIKDKNSMHYYIRYMDDGIIFDNDKEYLKELLDGMKVITEKLGLKFNDKKTYITKATKGFTFMKVRYFVSKENGKVVRKLDSSGVTRMRRKLKKFRVLVDKGEMSLDDVYVSMQSWLEHAKIASSYKTVKSMLKLYDKLFDGYKITRYWKHKQTRLSKQMQSVSVEVS